MIINFNKYLNNNGFIIRVDKDGYQESYREEERENISVIDGEYFLLSHYEGNKAEYTLIQINENNYKGFDVIIIEKEIPGEKSSNVIKNYLNKNL